MMLKGLLVIFIAICSYPVHASCVPGSDAQRHCEEFGRIKHDFGLAKLLFTEFIPKGSSFIGNTSGTSFFCQDGICQVLTMNAVSSYNIEQTDLPAACRIVVEVETSLSSHANFELWAPPKNSWNSRFLATGNGGWAGGVNYPSIVQGLRLNFATMSTDTGHNGSSADALFLLDPEAQTDL